jgi:hypothetical protein
MYFYEHNWNFASRLEECVFGKLVYIMSNIETNSIRVDIFTVLMLLIQNIMGHFSFSNFL